MQKAEQKNQAKKWKTNYLKKKIKLKEVLKKIITESTRVRRNRSLIELQTPG